MRLHSRYIDRLAAAQSTSFTDRFTRLFFVRALHVYLLFKIVLSWEVSLLVQKISVLSPVEPLLLKVLFFPGTLFSAAPVAFLILGIVLCSMALWRPNYLLSGLLFWYILNYFRVHYSLINGSDVVLVTLLFLSIGLSIFPTWKRWEGFQMLLFNGTSFVIKIQIAIIYLLSGIDKLYSPAWRSGEAIRYMVSLDYLFNPWLTGIVPTSPAVNFVVAWSVILFEIFFAVLIWQKRFRVWVLSIGVVFHGAIIVLLSLVDFGLIMILSYLIFLTDKDFQHGKWFQRKTTPILS